MGVPALLAIDGATVLIRAIRDAGAHALRLARPGGGRRGQGQRGEEPRRR